MIITLTLFIVSGVALITMIVGKSVMLNRQVEQSFESLESSGSTTIFRNKIDFHINTHASRAKQALLGINSRSVSAALTRFFKAAWVVILHTWMELSRLWKLFLNHVRRPDVPGNRGSVSVFLQSVSKDTTKE